MKINIQLIIIALIVLLFYGCAVRRPPFSPRRYNTDAHKQAQTMEDCIECHSGDKAPPHGLKRGNCLSCHQLERGSLP
ncbi:MAG: hypothetical protein KKE17_03855 [Proteobacteria bacterium]|nr:hypothetical protein [Pseudomonadota bacterium]MBU1709119.1 hypothetical protein [Pseudomonadota bacterium]